MTDSTVPAYLTLTTDRLALAVETSPDHPGWVTLAFRDEGSWVRLSLPPGAAWRLAQSLLRASRTDAADLASAADEGPGRDLRAL